MNCDVVGFCLKGRSKNSFTRKFYKPLVEAFENVYIMHLDAASRCIKEIARVPDIAREPRHPMNMITHMLTEIPLSTIFCTALAASAAIVGYSSRLAEGKASAGAWRFRSVNIGARGRGRAARATAAEPNIIPILFVGTVLP
jgi:hypothetical protein